MTISEQLRDRSYGMEFRRAPLRSGNDFGLDPAIGASGPRSPYFDRRRVSLRWLSGSLLTGISGVGLIGAAIYAALGHQTYLAESPAPALSQRKEINLDFGINPRKSDRLVKAVDIVAGKQRFQAQAVIRLGDKEAVKVHTFTHVRTALATSSVGLSEEVPPYNPLKVLADARNPIDAAQELAQDDAEIAWSTRELEGQLLSQTASLSNEEVQDQVAEQVKNTMAAGSRPLALPPQLLLMRTSRANLPGVLAYANPSEQISTAPFSSIEVRMVPENVTSVGRSQQAAQPTQMEERLVVIRHGDTVESVLRAAGLAREEVLRVIAAFGIARGDAFVAEGAQLKLLFADLDGSGSKMTLARLSVYSGDTLETNIAVDDRGGYVRVTAPRRTARRPNRDEDEAYDADAMRLYDSFYETALKQEIARPVIDDLVRIFANDVDFQRGVGAGDSFEALYDESEEGDGHNQLLYASITARGETYRYYRFQTPDDALVDYYDQDGRSTRKFLVRVPIVGGRFTSGFGIRFHPILGYSRPHLGVDWAAPMGTPIFAAGSGTIIKAEWDSGYGRRIEVQHANGYITTYNHLSGFARGARVGSHVRQGQVIGYLGQTGLATGPHLHYEILVNGHFVDPMRVKLARTREFDGRMLGNFKRERDRIDTLVLKAPNAPLVATRQ
ncbi:MAG: M23 family metallopeptidase [Beijerinckiaceae bacterium]|nr:M23 family metallopeptidase [Beijerinckiaceae bacterium]